MPEALPPPKKPAKVRPEEAHLEAAAAFTRDRDAEHDRLIKLLRGKGIFSHAELVELLGAQDVEVEHHDVVEGREKPDDEEYAGRLGKAEAPVRDDEGHQVFDKKGAPEMEKAGVRTVAHDSHTSRAFVAEVLG